MGKSHYLTLSAYISLLVPVAITVTSWMAASLHGDFTESTATRPGWWITMGYIDGIHVTIYIILYLAYMDPMGNSPCCLDFHIFSENAIFETMVFRTFWKDIMKFKACKWETAMIMLEHLSWLIFETMFFFISWLTKFMDPRWWQERVDSVWMNDGKFWPDACWLLISWEPLAVSTNEVDRFFSGSSYTVDARPRTKKISNSVLEWQRCWNRNL